MPQYQSPIWQDDFAAWKHLEQLGYTNEGFMIRPPVNAPPPDHITSEAINYLCGEWDWGYASED